MKCSGLSEKPVAVFNWIDSNKKTQRINVKLLDRKHIHLDTQNSLMGDVSTILRYVHSINDQEYAFYSNLIHNHFKFMRYVFLFESIQLAELKHYTIIYWTNYINSVIYKTPPCSSTKLIPYTIRSIYYDRLLSYATFTQ